MTPRQFTEGRSSPITASADETPHGITERTSDRLMSREDVGCWWFHVDDDVSDTTARYSPREGVCHVERGQ